MKKNNNKKFNYGDNKYREQINSVLKILVSVIIVLGLFYLLTVYLINKPTNSTSSSKKADDSSVSISYQTILASDSFSMSGSYLVLYYDFSSSDLKSKYTNLISSYTSSNTDKKVYVVDTSSKLNSSYVSDSSNNSPLSVDDLKVKSNTLISFENGSVVEYVEGQDEVTKFFE